MKMTKMAMAVKLGMTVDNLYRHLKRGNIKPDANRKYDFEQVEAYVKSRQELDNNNKRLSSKEKKLELECQYLAERIRIITKDYIPIQEHYNEMAEWLQILLSGVAQFKDHAVSMFPDPVSLKKCQEIEKKVRQNLIDKLDEKHESINSKAS